MKIETTVLSRYNGAEIINDGYKDRLETWNSPDLVGATGETYVVGSEYANRLDLVANATLGSPLLWWAIAAISDIKDPFSVPAGTVLLIPDSTTMAKLQGVL